jgi:hypothetical protein
MAYRSKSPPTLSIWTDDDLGQTDSEEASSQESLDSPSNNSINTSYDDNLNNILESAKNVNFEDIETIFGVKISNDKTKNQFVQRPGSDKALGVKLQYYTNNSDVNYNGQPTFTKVFIFNKNKDLMPDIVLEKILQEIFYHKQFYEVHEYCKFEMPELISYGYVTDSGDDSNYIFYIKMSLIEATSLTNKYIDESNEYANMKCTDVKGRLTVIAECLKEKGLYHNDLHSDNVMIDKLGNIVLIDFGEASDKETQIEFISPSFCDTLKTKSGGNKRRKISKKNIHRRKHNATNKCKRNNKNRLSKKVNTKLKTRAKQGRKHRMSRKITKTRKSRR